MLCRLASLIPPEKHLLGDVSYKIWGHLLVPFPKSEGVYDGRKCTYNKAHSRTRIVVECALGRLKNRFCILLGKLEQKSPGNICKVIMDCVVLHNLLILLKDSLHVAGVDPLCAEYQSIVSDDRIDLQQPASHLQGVAKRSDMADILIS